MNDHRNDALSGVVGRRNFLKAAAAGLAFPAIIPSSVLGKNAPSKRITLGFIGMGSQGMAMNMANFLPQEDARILAVCDAYLSRANRAAGRVDGKYGNTDCKVHQDFRELLENDSIDAVVISTPDHWHVPMSMAALAKGKDVFCEKPTLFIDEGRKLTEEVKKRKAVYQVGIEDRSLIHFHKIVEWVKNGAIGKLGRIEVTLPKSIDHAKEPPTEPPADLDWNLWQGPAAYHDFTQSRTAPMHWRYINAYSKGAILDIGSHLVDTAQLGADSPGVCPVTVEGTGMIPTDRLTDVPVTFDLNYRYANGVEMRVKNGKRGGWSPPDCKIRFEGDKGWIQRMSWNGGLEASDPAILRIRYEEGTSKHWPFPPLEQRNFLDCVKSREPTTYTAHDMHFMHLPLHMGVIAIQLGRKLRWDLKKEVFIDDDEANILRKGPEQREWATG